MNSDYLGQAEAPKEGMAERLISLAQQALPIYERQKILKAQIEAQKAGRAPIDVSQLSTPPVPIQVSASPEITRGLGAAGAVLLAAGVLAFVMTRKKGGR